MGVHGSGGTCCTCTGSPGLAGHTQKASAGSCTSRRALQHRLFTAVGLSHPQSLLALFLKVFVRGQAVGWELHCLRG